jgi:uncharacterized protein
VEAPPHGSIQQSCLSRDPCRLRAAGKPGCAAQVASFDCRASRATERAITAAPMLGRKDITVTAYYDVLLRVKSAVSDMAYREFNDKLRNEQRRWLAT